MEELKFFNSFLLETAGIWRIRHRKEVARSERYNGIWEQR